MSFSTSEGAFNRGRRFLEENGSYVFGASLVEGLCGLVRNHMMSRKLRVKSIKLGPYSRLRGLSSITIGEDFAAGPGFWLEALTRYNDQTFSPRVLIGSHVRISHFVHITSTHLVEIGDHVLMGSKVLITDHNHGQYSRGEQSSPQIPPTLRPLDRDCRVVIERDVWLGDGVVVTPGSSVGEGCVIGANSVVSGSIPAFTIAAGVPARPLKTFHFDTNTWRDLV